MESEMLARVTASVGQVLASLGVISAALFWRGDALGEVLASMGKFSRFSLMLPFTARLLRMRRYYLFRLLFFGGFIVCFLFCLYFLYLLMQTVEMIYLARTFDPGLLDLLLSESSHEAARSGWLALLGTSLMFAEWIVDGLCRYSDLDKSLEVFKISKCLELAETPVVEMERYVDILALWQRRLRLLVKKHPTNECVELLNIVGNTNIKWSDFSQAVCLFRRFAVNGLDAGAQKRDVGRDETKSGNSKSVAG